MSKHTSGPWFYGEDSDDEWYFAAAHDPNVQLGWVCPNEYGTQEANARLIAAAPELLEALQELLASDRAKPFEIVGRDTDGHPLNAAGVARKKARAAIAKATGEQ